MCEYLMNPQHYGNAAHMIDRDAPSLEYIVSEHMKNFDFTILNIDDVVIDYSNAINEALDGTGVFVGNDDEVFYADCADKYGLKFDEICLIMRSVNVDDILKIYGRCL